MTDLGDRLLKTLLSREDYEAVAGDLSEHFRTLQCEKNLMEASLWYWGKIIRSFPHVIRFSINDAKRGETKNWNQFFKSPVRFAVTEVVLILLAALLVTGGVLWSLGHRGFAEALDPSAGILFHPALVLGGLAVGLGLNLLAVMDVRLDNGVLNIAVALKGKLINYL